MRVLVYDRTCPRLSIAWRAGAVLYRRLQRLDMVRGVGSWIEALGWLSRLEHPIDELQYWGHGKWGALLAGDEVFDASALQTGHAYHGDLDAIRERLAPDALIWLRTCETFGAQRGHDFAQRLADFTGARVAGHTHVIGFHQSGLCGLRPGMTPHWSVDEGLVRGTADAPERAAWSHPFRPRTITCLRGDIPTSYFG